MRDRTDRFDKVTGAGRPDGAGPASGLFVASVEKAFRVLQLFSDEKVELSLSDVAQRSALGKSASQRFLYTLHRLGYLIQDPSSKSYRLSSKLLALSRSYSRDEILREKASPLLEQANRRCEETVNLTILDGTEVVYIVRFPSKHVVSVDLSVGTRLPAFCTAPGRVLLANLDEDQAERLISQSHLIRRTETTETDPSRLRRILKQVRQQGYCVSDQEAFVGDISVAAPVFDETGTIVAAVNIAVPTPRWSLAQVRRKLVPAVTGLAVEISDALGCPTRSP